MKMMNLIYKDILPSSDHCLERKKEINNQRLFL